MSRLPAIFTLAAAATATAACTTIPASDPVTQPEPVADQCDAGSAQSFVGRKADTATGTAIRDASGARILRWGPPNSAWTMDYRMDRVNVRYDEGMVITEITCG